MTRTRTTEQKFMMLLPLVVGVIWPITSFALGRFVMRGIPISTSLTHYTENYEVKSFIEVLSFLPFALLTLHLAFVVKRHSRRISYMVLLGGLIGIVGLYAPIEWMLFKPYVGGGADIGAGLVNLAKPFLALFTLLVGITIGQYVGKYFEKSA